MRKFTFLTTFILVLLSTCLFAQHTITRDEAFKIIKQKGLVDTLKNTVKASQQILQSKTSLQFMDVSIMSPDCESWFFLIDLQPSAEWGHPCKYVFVNTKNASLIIFDGMRGASFETDYLLMQKSVDLPTPAFFKKRSQVSRIKHIQKEFSKY